MKKFLTCLGAVVLIAFVLIAGGVAYFFYTNRGLEAEAHAYVDAAVPAISDPWNAEALLDRATPELKIAAPTAKVAQWFNQLAEFGRMKKYGGASGAWNASYTTGSGQVVTADYAAQADYENGSATFRIGLIKRNGRWSINSFYVDGLPEEKAQKIKGA